MLNFKIKITLYGFSVVSDSPFEKQRESQNHGILNSASSNGGNSKKTNKRIHRIIELYETEKRFVNILHSIIYVSCGLKGTKENSINFKFLEMHFFNNF